MTVAKTLGKAMLKNFYRCFTLPQHVKKAKDAGDTERSDSLAAELKRRKKAIADAELGAEFDSYVEAQKAKQAAYEASAVGDTSVDFPAIRAAFNAEYQEF